MPVLAYPDDLTDGVVRLRPWTSDDLGCVEQAATDPRIPENTSVPADWATSRHVLAVNDFQCEGLPRSYLEIGFTTRRRAGLLADPN
jgi:hypothetical protein